MVIDSQKISDLIIRYSIVEKKLQDPEIENGPDFQKLYNEGLYLSSTLRDIVLTGLEIVEKGIVKKIKEHLDSDSEEIKELEKKARYAEVYKKGIIKLGRRYKELKEEFEEPPIDYVEMVDNIREIISNKQGSIIDEINTVLEEYS